MTDLNGPYRKRSIWMNYLTNTALFILFCVAVFLVCIAFLRACTQYKYDYDWVSEKKLIQLHKYHGEDLKITETAVYIHRGGIWLPVFKREYK